MTPSTAPAASEAVDGGLEAVLGRGREARRRDRGARRRSRAGSPAGPAGRRARAAPGPPAASTDRPGGRRARGGDLRNAKRRRHAPAQLGIGEAFPLQFPVRRTAPGPAGGSGSCGTSSCWAQSASIRWRNESARALTAIRHTTDRRPRGRVGQAQRSPTDDDLAGFWWDFAALVPPYNRSPKLSRCGSSSARFSSGLRPFPLQSRSEPFLPQVVFPSPGVYAWDRETQTPSFPPLQGRAKARAMNMGPPSDSQT